MASDTPDRLSISTEDMDDTMAEPTAIELSITNSERMSQERLNLIKTFPWMIEGMRLCQADVGLTNIRALERLMKQYQRLVTQSVKDCYSRPNRAARLKRAMGDALLFFHMSYSDLKRPLEHSSYLAKMSDLMAMYLDMEIKASRTGTECLPKIASKLTSSLHVYFGRSHDHILDTVLKSKMITRNFWEISDLIFRRVLRDSPGSSTYIFSYIRYILAFKMWKGISKEPSEKKKIAELACKKLTPPPGFREKMSTGALRDVLPRVPKSREDATAFFLQAKFPVRDKIKLFLKAVQDPQLQCALDRHAFSSIEPLVSEQEEMKSSSLFNSIWSSLTTSSVSPLRTKNRKRPFRVLGKQKSGVFKKKSKLSISVEEVGEDDQPVFDEVVVEDDANEIKIENEENSPLKDSSRGEAEREEIDLGAEVKVPLGQLPDSQSNPDVKVEEALPLQASEPPPGTSDWGETDLQTYYSSISFEYLAENSKDSGYVVVSEAPAVEEALESYETEFPEEVEILDYDPEETEAAEAGPVSSSQSLDQEVEVVEVPSIKKEDKREEPVSNRVPPSNEQQNSMTNEIGLLHDYTITSDSKMYEFQKKVFNYAAKLTLRTWINLLRPLFSHQQKLKMYRCLCTSCKSNLIVIRNNWKDVMRRILNNSDCSDDDGRNIDEQGYSYENSLEDLKAVAEGEKGDMMYWEPEIDGLLKKMEETLKEESESATLPLKKRKAVSATFEGGRNDDWEVVSYPATPMISIAELISAPSRPDYTPYINGAGLNPHLIPSQSTIPPANSFVQNQRTLPEQTTPAQASYSSISSDPEQEFKRFKTPAELKEFGYPHLSAAHDLLDFANSYQSTNRRRQSLKI